MSGLPVLVLEDLNVFYGGIHALKGISLRVAQGQIVTLIGANGAGKSTTLRAITGLVRARKGSIRLDGREILGLKAHRIVQQGVAMAPEGRRIFPNLSVRENLMMGAYHRSDADGVQADLERVYQLFPRLHERRDQSGGTLSGGEQQMLAVGRALMSHPRILCLDEPSLGLAPSLRQEVFRALEALHGQGRTILLVEQNARAALRLAEYAYVLETGRVVLEGPAAELAENEQVRRAYLGEG
ncbi:ABC transporter ATP-binding protein [Limnochorda pilosa]|uniref:Amino acid ABC transporter ATPase n=1 Tax=Limnochorda pilosa TaxID=1555112 RepID=A0A0K2SL89_LIMPI|nr:ABC transporter ATP-binding protein [Limnochorda pilosa]BAS27762.1 amino acid ABC transporter ATPase [Limnochorda pilosa]